MALKTWLSTYYVFFLYPYNKCSLTLYPISSVFFFFISHVLRFVGRLEDLWLNDNQIESLEGIAEAVAGSKDKLVTVYFENNPCVCSLVTWMAWFLWQSDNWTLLMRDLGDVGIALYQFLSHVFFFFYCITDKEMSFWLVTSWFLWCSGKDSELLYYRETNVPKSRANWFLYVCLKEKTMCQTSIYEAFSQQRYDYSFFCFR